MKKTLALIISLAMVLALAACGKTDEPLDNGENANVTPASPTEISQVVPASPTEISGVANPMVAVESLDAINEQLNCNLVAPGVMGVTDESFYVISGEMGEYNFSVNGVPYTFRFQNTEEDICGIYVGDSTLLANAGDGDVVATEGVIGSRWFAEEGQYCLTSSGDVDSSLFAGIVEELQGVQSPAETDVMELPASAIVGDPLENQSWYDNLQGCWQDMTSGRATMDVVSIPGAALINVSWGDSASCTYEWTMTVNMEEAAEDGTNKLVYTDCTSRKVESDGTTDTVTILYEGGEGFFTLNEGGFLAWDGAAEENCAECVFEMLGE